MQHCARGQCHGKLNQAAAKDAERLQAEADRKQREAEANLKRVREEEEQRRAAKAAKKARKAAKAEPDAQPRHRPLTYVLVDHVNSYADETERVPDHHSPLSFCASVGIHHDVHLSVYMPAYVT